MDTEDDDLDTQLLVTQVQLDDLAAAQSQQKGKARIDAPATDTQVALHHQKVVLEEQQILLRDRRLAQSVYRAVDADREMLILMASVDQAERDDRVAAEALSRDEALPAETDYQRSLPAYMYQLGQDNEFARRRGYAQDTASTASSSTLVSSATRSTPARLTSSTFPAPSLVSTIKPSDSASMARSSVSSSSAPSLLSLLGASSLLGSKAATKINTTKSSSASRSAASGTSTQRAECVVCTERRRVTMMCRAPCGHMYCNGCIIDLVGACTNDETLFPIRCCQRNIPEGDFTPRLPNELQDAYRARATEYLVPAKRRVYCANPRCSHFLGTTPDVHTDRVCERCTRATCTRCRAAVHPGSMCGEPEALRALDALATGNGWRRCGGCNAIVELTQGCFHITCRCRHQFCYLCGRTWKSCPCPQWEEGRLMADAERRVNNAHGVDAAAADPERHAERLEEAIDELQEDHICTGHTWAYRHGEGTCEECGNKESVFLMRCTHCQTLACRRCTQNRL